MNLIPFRQKERHVPARTTVRFVGFHPPRELADYGFDGVKPRRDDRTPSGFLLPWAGIDAERDRRVNGGPCELVVAGEYIDETTGQRWPALVVSETWMEDRGYTRTSEIKNGHVVYGPWKSRDSA